MGKETSGQSELFPEHATKYSNRSMGTNPPGRGHRVVRIDRSWLQQKYWTDGLTLKELAGICGCHPETVRKNFIRHSIPRRTLSAAISKAKGEEWSIKNAKGKTYTNRKILDDLYSEQKLNSVEIGKILGIKSNTVMRWLRKHGIHIGPKRFRPRDLTDKDRRRLSIRAKAIWARPGYREHQRVMHLGTMAGEKNINYGSKYSSLPKVREKISQANKGRKIGKAEMERRLLSWNRRPSRLEGLFIEIAPRIVRYVGDGTWWRSLEDGRYHNPDFKVTGQNKVIEIFGAYWHKDDDGTELMNLYAKAGLRCLIIKESEFYPLSNSPTKRFPTPRRRALILKKVHAFLSL